MQFKYLPFLYVDMVLVHSFLLFQCEVSVPSLRVKKSKKYDGTDECVNIQG